MNNKTEMTITPSLTERELQLLFLIANEYSNSEMAKKLFLSKNTIDSHKKNLFMKLNVSNSAGLITKAFQLNLLPMEKPESLN